MHSLPGGSGDGPGSLHRVSRLGGYQAGAGHEGDSGSCEVFPEDAGQVGQGEEEEEGIRGICTARL